jgi:hypothetical protein
MPPHPSAASANEVVEALGSYFGETGTNRRRIDRARAVSGDHLGYLRHRWCLYDTLATHGELPPVLDGIGSVLAGDGAVVTTELRVVDWHRPAAAPVLQQRGALRMLGHSPNSG